MTSPRKKWLVFFITLYRDHTMLYINRKNVLDTLAKHETLTFDDIGNEENMGFVANRQQLKFLLLQLTIRGYVQILAGANPLTYTITTDGINERNRLVRL